MSSTSSIHVTLNGKPWCIASYKITRDVVLAGYRGGCAHASKESAEAHVNFVKKMFPAADMQIVAGSCPAYADAFRDQWED